MASRRSEVLRLVRRLEGLGCKCRQSKRNSHWKVYYNGRMISSIASTPSDPRSMQNTLRDLERAGLILA